MYSEQPWWMRWWALATAAVVLIAATATTVLVLTRGGDDPQDTSGKNPSSPPSTSSTDSTNGGESSSYCGLPDGDQAVPDEAPSDTRWLMTGGGMAAPSIEGQGPEVDEDGVHSCFAHNPTAAVMSAVWFVADQANPDVNRQDLALSRVAAGPLQIEVGMGEPPTGGGGTELAGFQFIGTPTRDAVDVNLLFSFDTNDQYVALRLPMVWEAGDWVFAPTRSEFEVEESPAPEDFTLWQSADATAGQLGRPMPGWAPQHDPDPSDPQPDPPFTKPEQKWASNYEKARSEIEFSLMSHEERHEVMTPSPPLTPEERAWLNLSPEDQEGVFTWTSSEALAVFYDLSAEQRANVMAGLTPEGEPIAKDSTADKCDSLLADVQGCMKNAGNALENKAKEKAGELADSAFGRIAEQSVEAAEWAVKTMMTAWLAYPDPKVSQCYGGSTSCADKSVTAWVQGNLHWLVVLAMIASLMIGAMRMALTGRAEHGRDAAASLTKAVVVAFGAGAVIVSALEASDMFAEWILGQADPDFTSLLGVAGLTTIGNPVVLLLLGLLVLLTQLIQLALMVMRAGMVVALAGMLPLAASMTNTQVGKQWFAKSAGWLAAWILYKPVAALVYAIAFKMTSSDQDIAGQLSGIFMMILAVLALPALMRFLVPAVAAASAGNAGAIAGAMVGGAVATGAMVATGGAAAGAMSGGGGFAGFAGSTGGGSPGGVTSPPAGASPQGGGSSGQSSSSSASGALPVGGQSTPPSSEAPSEAAPDTSGSASGADPAAAAASGSSMSPSGAPPSGGAASSPAAMPAMAGASGSGASGPAGPGGAAGGGSSAAPAPASSGARSAGSSTGGVVVQEVAKVGSRVASEASGAVEKERQG